MMRHLLPLVLLATACGSPFETTTKHPEPDASDEALPPVEAGADHNVAETGHPGEAGHEADVDSDAPVIVTDAGHDALPPADAGCTPFVAKGPGVCGAASPPESFCTFFDISSSYLPSTTPVECQCATTFTCACLYAHGVDTSAFCAGGGVPVKCTDNANSGPSVECP